MGDKVVYLVGGMRTNWQGKVKSSCLGLGFTFKDPCINNTSDFNEYTLLDLHHVKTSDIIFAYIEKDNPAGHGACVECGYAKGLGKTVIVINEKPEDRYLKFIEKVADIVFSDFEKGVEFLKKFQ